MLHSRATILEYSPGIAGESEVNISIFSDNVSRDMRSSTRAGIG